MYELPTGKQVKEFRLTLTYARDKFEKSNVNRLRVA
jgi:hypothetical protein